MSTYAARDPFSSPVRAALITLIYVALIPFINWSFTWAPMVALPGLGWMFNPVTIVTGLVLVARDFAQREIGHWVLLAMAVALVLTWLTTGPELALASGIAFGVSEMVDWAVFTFTKLKLSTRVLLSSALAAPIDTSVFLLGAEAIRDGQFTLPNVVMSIAGKMVGALAIWWLIRRTLERPDRLREATS
ncbi:MAG: VUT family protein [Litorimonas sp.]